MKKENVIKTYTDYKNKIGNRRALYKKVIDKYDVKSVLSLLAQENSIQIYDLGGDELSSLFDNREKNK